MATSTKKRIAPKAAAVASDLPESAETEAGVPDGTPAELGPLVVPFRGVEFEVSRDVFSSARFLLCLRQFRYQDILFEVLGPDDNTDKFLGTLKFKEAVADVANEFLDALNTAAGWTRPAVPSTATAVSA